MFCTCWSALTVDGFLNSRDGAPSDRSLESASAMSEAPALRGTLDLLAVDVRDNVRPPCMLCTSSNTRSPRPHHDGNAHGFTG
jgi:hypothetical protein